MRSPTEIAARCVQEELYARAAFAKLIARPANELRSAVEADARAQTESMARLILDYYDENVHGIPAEEAVDIVQAAAVAARGAEPHVRCRVEKDLANALRSVGSFGDAEAALRAARSVAGRTLASEVHHAVVDFAWMALLDDSERPEEAAKYATSAIEAFEKHGACDRAYLVRLYEAHVKGRRGEHLAALAAYRDAARRASKAGSRDDLALAYYNIAQCYRGLGDFCEAKAFFGRAARVYRRQGKHALEARSLRCVARMAIRLRGADGVGEMEPAKSIFLNIGAAGEVCRSIIAVMQELLERDRDADLALYCRQLRAEALVLGVKDRPVAAVRRLQDAAQTRTLTPQLLQDSWDAFGPGNALAPLSQVAITHN